MSVSVGDVATLLPGGERCRVTKVYHDCLEIERGPLEPGWSGTPVAVHGHVVGFVHGTNGDQAVVIPLPLRALAAALHVTDVQSSR